MKEKPVMSWYNFRTEEYEYRETPEDFSDYVPQIGGLGLYKIYVEHYHMTPVDACIKVLKIATGNDDNQETTK